MNCGEVTEQKEKGLLEGEKMWESSLEIYGVTDRR